MMVLCLMGIHPWFLSVPPIYACTSSRCCLGIVSVCSKAAKMMCRYIFTNDWDINPVFIVIRGHPGGRCYAVGTSGVFVVAVTPEGCDMRRAGF